MQVDARELLGHEVEQARFCELVDLRVELEGLEDVPNRRGEALHVGSKVFADVVLVPHQLLQVERRRIEEELLGLLDEEWLGVQPSLLSKRLLGEHGGLRAFENAVEPPEDGERQDDLAVLGLLVIAAEEIGDRPDEGGEVRRAHERGATLRDDGFRRRGHEGGEQPPDADLVEAGGVLGRATRAAAIRSSRVRRAEVSLVEDMGTADGRRWCREMRGSRQGQG